MKTFHIRLKQAIRLIAGERIQITALVGLTRSECDARMHTGQLSRISRDTRGVVLNVTVSRQRSRMSCHIFIIFSNETTQGDFAACGPCL